MKGRGGVLQICIDLTIFISLKIGKSIYIVWPEYLSVHSIKVVFDLSYFKAKYY